MQDSEKIVTLNKTCIYWHSWQYLIALIFHLVYSTLVLQKIYSSSLSTRNQIYHRYCDKQNFYYESIQVKVIESGYYSFGSLSSMDVYGFIYRNTFNPLNPAENLLPVDVDSNTNFQFRLNIHLSSNMTYVLIMTTYRLRETGTFSIVVLGTHKVTLERLSKYIYMLILSLENVLNSKHSWWRRILFALFQYFNCNRFIFSFSIGTSVNIQLVYWSKLTADSPTYDRGSELAKSHYETFEITVVTKGAYVLWSESDINTIGYIYKNDFDSLKPSENLLVKHDGSCNDGKFKLMIDLEIRTRYVLVVTTNRPNTIGNFSIFISGPNNITLNQWRSSIPNMGMTVDFNDLLYICAFFICLHDRYRKYIG